MKRGRAAALARRRALAFAMALAVVGSALAPAVPGWAGTARAQEGSGTIVHSADGVLMRAEPNFGAQVLETLPQGTQVGLRTYAADTVYDPDGVTQWWPVSSSGEDGWVAGFYLQIDGFGEQAAQQAAPAAVEPTVDAGLGGETPADTAVDQFQATWDDLASAVAVVSEPEGVNLRSEPSASSAAVRSLSFDTVVNLRINDTDTVYMEGTRWWPVSVDGLLGWVSGAYLRPAEAWQQTSGDTWTDTAQWTDTSSSDDTWFTAGSYVAAATDDGTGLNIRADGAPDAERIGMVPESDVVQIMEGPTWDPAGNPWYLITTGNVTGYVNGRYLAAAGQPGDAQSPVAPAKTVMAPGVATGAIGYPLANWTFTQGFGCSPYYFEPWNAAVGCNYHNGIDLAAPMYTPLAAADGGTVTFSGWCDCGLGYYVKIDHGDGFETLYGHMASQPPVQVGQAVSKGEVIGEVGSTGMSTGPHVHFIVKYLGQDVDPLTYIS
ncbi:MAG: peptidoglycan DD-metalloendopeptidase family protein [Thermomicrobiales bacterium]